MIAADMVGKGHITEYPLDEETHALQISFKDGKLPTHRDLGLVLATPVSEAPM